MPSNKNSSRLLASVFKENGITDVVFSPGSRNAPLVEDLSPESGFNTLVVPDERSAAFIALGIAQFKLRPVVICCTSGTACLNYFPAIAEAFYQGIPLIAITADRPEEWINQGEGQSIMQQNVYGKHVKDFLHLSENCSTEEGTRLLVKSIQRCLKGHPGPIHINTPFSEPLYEVGEVLRTHNVVTPKVSVQNELPEELKKVWAQSKKRLILVGQLPHSHSLHAALEAFTFDKRTVVVTETTSHLWNRSFCQNIDRLISNISEDVKALYTPDIIVTIGGQVISKKIKALFRDSKPKEHWHFGPDSKNVFQALTHSVEGDPANLLKQLHSSISDAGEFGTKWLKLDWETRVRHEQFTEQAPYSDFLVFRELLDHIPEGFHLHLANSTPIRYAQLFDQVKGVKYFANRGTSGIDGSTSTALGSAIASNNPTALITGDMSFFYDSNAFWNVNPPDHFKVFLINNGGGNIFKIIDGPSSTTHLEKNFEVTHAMHAEHLSNHHGLKYMYCNDLISLRTALSATFNDPTPSLVEIDTIGCNSEDVLKAYFKFLRN